MKKIISISFVLLCLIILAGCGASTKNDELLKYLPNDTSYYEAILTKVTPTESNFNLNEVVAINVVSPGPNQYLSTDVLWVIIKKDGSDIVESENSQALTQTLVEEMSKICWGVKADLRDGKIVIRGGLSSLVSNDLDEAVNDYVKKGYSKNN